MGSSSTPPCIWACWTSDYGRYTLFYAGRFIPPSLREPIKKCTEYLERVFKPADVYLLLPFRPRRILLEACGHPPMIASLSLDVPRHAFGKAPYGERKFSKTYVRRGLKTRPMIIFSYFSLIVRSTSQASAEAKLRVQLATPASLCFLASSIRRVNELPSSSQMRFLVPSSLSSYSA